MTRYISYCILLFSDLLAWEYYRYGFNHNFKKSRDQTNIKGHKRDNLLWQ